MFGLCGSMKASTHLEPAFERRLRWRPKGHDALLVTLTHYRDDVAGEVDIRDVGLAQLLYTHPSGIQQFHDGQVACRYCAVLRRDFLDCCLNLLRREHFREMLMLLRC